MDTIPLKSFTTGLWVSLDWIVKSLKTRFMSLFVWIPSSWCKTGVQCLLNQQCMIEWVSEWMNVVLPASFRIGNDIPVSGRKQYVSSPTVRLKLNLE